MAKSHKNFLTDSMFLWINLDLLWHLSWKFLFTKIQHKILNYGYLSDEFKFKVLGEHPISKDKKEL